MIDNGTSSTAMTKPRKQHGRMARTRRAPWNEPETCVGETARTSPMLEQPFSTRHPQENNEITDENINAIELQKSRKRLREESSMTLTENIYETLGNAVMLTHSDKSKSNNVTTAPKELFGSDPNRSESILPVKIAPKLIDPFLRESAVPESE
jgi:hypothetical protein